MAFSLLYSSETFEAPVTLTGDTTDIQVPAGDDLVIKMGDNAAANKVSFVDSDSVEVASIDSNGVITGTFTTTSSTIASATGGTLTLGRNDLTVASADVIGVIDFQAKDTDTQGGSYESVASIKCIATENYSGAATAGTKFSFLCNPATTETPQEEMALSGEQLQIDHISELTATHNVEFDSGILQTQAADDSLTIDGSTTATTADVLVVNVKTATAGIDGIIVSAENTKTTGQTLFGVSSLVSSTAVVTADNQTLYGLYGTATKTGADTSVDTTTLYGAYATASNTGSTAVGTKLTYGGYFSATGDGSGTTTTYGIYSAATGADANYAGWFSGDVAVESASGGVLNINRNDLTVSSSDNIGSIVFNAKDTDVSAGVYQPVASIIVTAAEDFDDSNDSGSNINFWNCEIGSETQSLNMQLSASGVLKIDHIAECNGAHGIEIQDSATFTLAAGDSVTIDGATTDNTTSSLVINHDTATTNADAISVVHNCTKTTGVNTYALDVLALWDKVVTDTAGSMYGIIIDCQKLGADTSNKQYDIIGLNINAIQTGSGDQGTKNTYGINVSASGDTAGTSTAYGIYTGASGADTNYAIYAGQGSCYFYTRAAEPFLISDVSGTKNSLATGKFYLTSDTLTASTKAALIAYNDYRTTGDGDVTALGLAVGDSAVKTANDAQFYGLTSAATINAAHSTGGTITAYGASITASQTGSTDAGTRITYGLYASATGDAAGTSTAYGVYGTATGADVNYAGYFSGNLYASGAFTGTTSISQSPAAAGAFTSTAGSNYNGTSSGAVQTTDGTVTTIFTHTLGADQCATFHSVISGILSDGSKAFSTVIYYSATKDGAAGATEQLANTVVASSNDDAAVFVGCAWTVSGDTAILQVTGAAANTINWSALVQFAVADI